MTDIQSFFRNRYVSLFAIGFAVGGLLTLTNVIVPTLLIGALFNQPLRFVIHGTLWGLLFLCLEKIRQRFGVKWFIFSLVSCAVFSFLFLVLVVWAAATMLKSMG